MPSQADVPSTADLLDAYDGEIAALHRDQADLRPGSGYDVNGGAAAVLFHRQALRDRDGFRATYFDTAQGLDADTLIRGRYGILAARIPDTAGTGVASLARHTAVGGAGTFRAGTRLSALPTGAGVPITFEVSTDTPAGGSDLQARVPIRAVLLGASQAVNVTASTNGLSIDDPVWDATWKLTAIQCTPGLARESDDAYKARIKATRQATRRGYETSIRNACLAVGAGQVALFPSDWSGVDHGINHCFVADSSFVTTPALLTACRIAVDGVRVLGADLFVFGMQTVALSIALELQVWDVTKTRASDDLSALAAAAVVDYFASRENAFYWTAAAIQGAVIRQIRGELQDVIVTPSLSEPNRATMLDTALLSRYVVDASSVTVTVVAPS